MENERREEFFIKATPIQILSEMWRMNLLKRQLECLQCSRTMKLSKTLRNIDGFVWRCCNATCENYRVRISVRKGSSLESFKISFKTIIKIFTRWCEDQQQFSILRTIAINKTTYLKVTKMIIEKIKMKTTLNHTKLGGVGQTINVDETMLNYKCKSHRGRSPGNRTDALCIVELDNHITRAFACVIPNKKKETLIPLIIENVELGSIIHTDELKSYLSLRSEGFQHLTVCHKYRFVDGLTGAQTQAVESFNNLLKAEIKKRKGVRTNDRADFLVEFVWKFNNRCNRFNALLSLLEVI